MATRRVSLQTYVSPSESKALWVFGYGSLCWKPGFQFDKAIIGHVRGYSRKFWQGNTTHRGTDKKPGRVATLIDDDKSAVYGVAFSVNEESAIPYLTNRECTLGGYDTRITNFYPLCGEPIKVLVYIATPKNIDWLGDAPNTEIARQIFTASGPCGHNIEYVVRLADFMRLHFPGESDDHLFSLEAEILAQFKEHNLHLTDFMGDGTDCIEFKKNEVYENQNRMEREDNERPDTFQFASRVPEKTLRCLNI